MNLRIYNTLTRQKNMLEPVENAKIGMYVCGVTVYDMCHIGHARSIVFFDVVFRYLAYRGFDVTYVRNFTDVDDKIIKRANERKENWKDLAERYIEEFYTDMDALGVLRPTVEPKATEHIDEIVSMVQQLVDSGHAYVAEGDVMFAVESYVGYGALSGKRIEDLISGSRVEIDAKKKNPLDFVLWKGAKPGEPSWDSPWGPGRPGWHIECSAMSTKYLGHKFDIHGGGADLAFPHHENEIAQARAASGDSFAQIWMHNGFINISNEKMSKSLGNVLNIRDILQTVHPEALRLFLLSKHYRSPLDYNETSIHEASASLERLYSAWTVLGKLIEANGSAGELPPELSNLRERFIEAMDDDFNTSKCVASLFEAARALNKMYDGGRFDPAGVPKPELLKQMRSEIADLSGGVLGLLSRDPDRYAAERGRLIAPQQTIPEAQTIEKMIAARAKARSHKNFAMADRIRDWLAERNIGLKDGPRGTTWEIRSS